MQRFAGVVWAALSLTCSDGVGPNVDRDAGAGAWRTWVLTSGDELRPAAPPDIASPEGAAELQEILQLQAARTGRSDSLVRYWSALPTTPWHTLVLDLSGFYWALLPDVRIATPAHSARAFALLHVAMYDALVATWAAKYHYNRPAPAATDGHVQALVPVDDVPSYPSEHAAAAAAAAGVLSYLFPNEDTATFHARAREAGESRIVAGAAFRSDVEAGFAIGRAVANRTIGRARGDGSAESWRGTIPSGLADWRPTPSRFVSQPFDPTAGNWRTWVIGSGDAFRPRAPPLPGSIEFERDLEELRLLSTTRTAAQANVARYWASESPSARWQVFMQEEIVKRRLGSVRAARALALASVATYDAMVACWDAKYTYWLLRPVSVDPAVRTVFSTPPFPSYPSGHSTLSSAAAEVFAELFPSAAAHYRRLGEEASLSRVYAGVHFRFDVVEGETLGRRVGQAVVARARADGADGR